MQRPAFVFGRNAVLLIAERVDLMEVLMQGEDPESLLILRAEFSMASSYSDLMRTPSDEPSIGSSIGICDSETGSATLCCYVSSDTTKYLLSVGHFVDKDDAFVVHPSAEDYRATVDALEEERQDCIKRIEDLQMRCKSSDYWDDRLKAAQQESERVRGMGAPSILGKCKVQRCQHLNDIVEDYSLFACSHSRSNRLDEDKLTVCGPSIVPSHESKVRKVGRTTNATWGRAVAQKSGFYISRFGNDEVKSLSACFADGHFSPGDSRSLLFEIENDSVLRPMGMCHASVWDLGLTASLEDSQ